MGKLTPAHAPSGGAVPLYHQPATQYYDQDAPDLPAPEPNDDLPPLYDEAAEASGSHSLSAPLLPTSHFPPSGSTSVDFSPFRRDETVTYYLDSRLDDDPERLESAVRNWATVPPRPFVHLHGYHRERRRDHDGKRRNKNVTDFDIKVELTPYLFANPNLRQAWSETSTVDNEEKAKRGTVLRKRAPGFRKGRASSDGGGRIELGAIEKPNLTQWCHMFCASHSGLKVFQLKRRMLGFDYQHIREKLEGMVRGTNYRGHLQITFPVQDESVEVWNNCRTNQWRLTKWIYNIFCLSMLWLLTWPYLFFRTKRFETVTSDWYFSRPDGDLRKQYVSISEDQWCNLWGRAIAKAALSKREGVLDQQDLLAAEGAPPELNSGNAMVNGAVSFVRAGVNAMNEVNRNLGWGGDHF